MAEEFKYIEEPKSVDSRLSHIAFIMDGNGRWAKKKGLPRPVGHIMGTKNFVRVLNHCKRIGVKTVTVYAFSRDNWKRPKTEVEEIFLLLSQFIEKAMREMEINETSYKFIGDMSDLPADLQKKISLLEETSKIFPLRLNIALNYGSRYEIVQAVNSLIKEGKEEVTEEDIREKLYTSESPYPDLLIRTGGECRLSDFLLWQLQYTELCFSDVLWPDLDNVEIDRIIENFYSRDRRYGALNDKDKSEK